MGQPAARLTDMTAHLSPLAPGGNPKVLIGKLPAWTVMDTHMCPMPIAPPAPAPHAAEKLTLFSKTVKIGGFPAARMGDTLQGAGPPNSILLGCFTVLIGG